MTTYGRRNIALLTIAPTGTVSICTQTSSGIEPVFKVFYIRKRKVNPNNKDVKNTQPDITGDTFELYSVLHPKFKVWAEVNGYNPEHLNGMTEKELDKIVEKSPYYKATANEIDWLMKVKLQGTVQKWVDHSISVTVNLPKDVEEELVDRIYRTAWANGCKGITVYRDGSRGGGIYQNAKEGRSTSFQYHNAPKRPEKMEAEIVRFTNYDEGWIAVVGLYEGKPYEIFTGRSSDLTCLPKEVEKGWVRRVKNKKTDQARYDFIFLDNQGYEIIIQGLSRKFKKEYWDYAKLISGILRHGMPIHKVVELISKLSIGSDNDMMTWRSGVARALKKYVENGTKSKNLCPECLKKGIETQLEFKEGCEICPDCGHTLCK
jgi:ribonucleoside-diphosphate reductase alpha chain